jgi:hypothetical protein
MRTRTASIFADAWKNTKTELNEFWIFCWTFVGLLLDFGWVFVGFFVEVFVEVFVGFFVGFSLDFW